MRYAAGTWRNVNDIPIEDIVTSELPIQIVYKHPAAGDDAYIATITEQQYAIFKEAETGEILYIEPRKDSGRVNVFRKNIEIYEPVVGIVVEYDANTKTHIQTQSQTTTEIGVYDEVEGIGEFGYLTFGSRPSVGNILYKEFLGDMGGITEIGVITSVRRALHLEQGIFYNVVVNDTTVTLSFKEMAEKELPNGIKVPVSVIPPDSVISIKAGETMPQVLCQYDPYQELKVDHFGNTLLINRPELATFVLRDGKYYYTDFSRIHFLCKEVQRGSGIDDSFAATGIAIPETFKEDALAEYRTGKILYYPLANKGREMLLKTYDGEDWRGEICYFLVARMEDGTAIAVSPLFIRGDNPSKSMPIVLQKYNGEKVYCLYRGADPTYTNNFNNLTEEQMANQHPIAGGWCTVEFSMVTDNDNPLIYDIALYSTRIMPTFDLAKLGSLDDSTWEDYDSSSLGSAGAIFSDTAKALANEPFYLVDSISWSDYKKKGRRSFDLSYTTLKGIASNAIFEPNNNIAPIISYNTYQEYNNCAHFGGVTRYIPRGFVYEGEMIQHGGVRFEPSYDILYNDGYKPEAPDDDRDYDSDFYPDDDRGYDDMEVYAMRNSAQSTEINFTDMIVRVARRDKKLYSITKGIYPNDQSISHWAISNIVSYPDASADSLMFATGTTKGSQGVECPLTPLNAINYAIYIPSSYRKFEPEWSPRYEENRVEILKDIEEDTVFTELNKMMVSQTNNNFKFPFDQTYSIGTESNQILAINSGAIEMSDAKFGEMPLYVFTQEGIYAMQSGQNNVLYSATIPINYDRIINPQTLAVNYNIVYITREGVKSLSAQTTSLLSEAINGPNNIPLLDYLQSANLYHHKPYNEIIVHNPDYDYAYIYAVNGGYWSTRDLRGVKLDSERLYIWNLIGNSASHLILNLAKHEGNEVRPISIRTRPLKFGNHEFKRLETFIARMRAVPGAAVTIRFYGSNDRVNWALMREVEFENIDVEMTLRRFPFSARYIYVEFESDGIEATGAYFEISSMDMEYYLKFVRRLR